MRYLNFDLEIFEYQKVAGLERFRVRVAQSPAGQQKYTDAETVTLSSDLWQQILKLEVAANVAEIIALGKNLADLLLPPQARSFFRRSQERLGDDEGLRVRLRFDAPALGDIPWEYIYLPKSGVIPGPEDLEGFLVLDRQISLVRHEIEDESPAPFSPIATGPLRLAAVLADPDSPNYSSLHLDEERQIIELALERTEDFAPAFYPHATLTDLEDALAQDTHIFHFAGFGEIQGGMGNASQNPENQGCLVLVDENGKAASFPADELARYLKGRGVRLVVLGASVGGRRNHANAWPYIAHALARADIPAIVGLQYAIKHENAIIFMKRLYTALAAGQSIDEAISDGRLAIQNAGKAQQQDWGAPVLYLHSAESVLFPKSSPTGIGALGSQLKPGQPGFIVLLSVIGALFLSLLASVNQLAGFFTKLTLPTVVLSILLALIIVVALPTLLRTRLPEGERILKVSYRRLAILLAALILLAGVGPYSMKYWIATTAKAEGTRLADLRSYAPARIQLERAAQYFNDLGLSAQTVDAKLSLTQVYASLGEGTRAESTIAEIENSEGLNGALQGKLYLIKGNLAQDKGQFEQAERYYQLSQQSVEPRSQTQAALLQNQGVLWEGRGAPYRERVLNNYKQAQEIYQNLGDNQGLAQILINEGNLYLNDPEQARSFYTEAQLWAEKAQDPYTLGVSLMNAGKTYRQQGNLDQALALYDQAQQQFEAAADLVGQAEVTVNRATVEWVRGHRELARQYLQTAEAYLKNIDVQGNNVNQRHLAQIRSFQADIYDEFGESETARKLYEEALAIYRDYPQALQEANTQVNYGTLLLRLGQAEEARNLFERAREILEALSGQGPNESLGVLYNDLGKANQDIGDLDSALKYYAQAEKIFETLGEPLETAMAKENIGLVYGFQGDFAKAIEAVREAYTIYQQQDNVDHQVSALYNLYSLYGPSHDPAATKTVADILSLLKTHSVAQETEASVLFGILPQDIKDPSQLITYRERLLQLKAFYEQQKELTALGQCLLKLAGVEQKLGNNVKMVEYARTADTYVEHIPLPARIAYLTDLGFYLWDANPQTSFDHFLDAFELVKISSNINQQILLAQAIDGLVRAHAAQLDIEQSYNRAKAAVATTQSDEVRQLFQATVDYLETYRK